MGHLKAVMITETENRHLAHMAKCLLREGTSRHGQAAGRPRSGERGE